MEIDIDDRHNELDCYILGDQPVTCGICGARTTFFEKEDGMQIHRCMNTVCDYRFCTVDD